VLCAICGESIDAQVERWLRTTDRAAVHLTCAERTAQQAWQQRQRRAVMHLLLIGVVSVTLPWLGNATHWLPTFIIAWLGLHARLHHRWWYYLGRDLCGCWRGRHRLLRKGQHHE